MIKKCQKCNKETKNFHPLHIRDETILGKKIWVCFKCKYPQRAKKHKKMTEIYNLKPNNPLYEFISSKEEYQKELRDIILEVRLKTILDFKDRLIGEYKDKDRLKLLKELDDELKRNKEFCIEKGFLKI